MADSVCADCPSTTPSACCEEGRSSFSGLPFAFGASSIPAISSSSFSSSTSPGGGAAGASSGLSDIVGVASDLGMAEGWRLSPAAKNKSLVSIVYSLIKLFLEDQ